MQNYSQTLQCPDVRLNTNVLMHLLGLPAGKTYRSEVEKRKASLTLRVQESGNPKYSVEHTWDTSKNPNEQQPRFIQKGRIGLRQMGGGKVIYKNFSVHRL